MASKPKRVKHCYRALHQEVTSFARVALELAGNNQADVDRKVIVEKFRARSDAPDRATLYNWLKDVLGAGGAHPSRRGKPAPQMARDGGRQPPGGFDRVDQATADLGPERASKRAAPEDREFMEVPMVRERDGIAYATSADVADFFGKRHADVLRDIDVLMAHGANLHDEEKRALAANFREMREPHPTVAGRMDRVFHLTRDGFALLAMGFTGPKALLFKLAYIAAFNRMEDRIRQAIAAETRLAIPAGPTKAELGRQSAAILGAKIAKVEENADARAAGLHATIELLEDRLERIEGVLSGGFTLVPVHQAMPAAHQAGPRATAARPRQGSLPV